MWEIRVRAERRAGEISRGLPKIEDGLRRSVPRDAEQKSATLAAAGISAQQACANDVAQACQS
jgi:hypothetical protein